jgi:hypothetical protein
MKIIIIARLAEAHAGRKRKASGFTGRGVPVTLCSKTSPYTTVCMPVYIGKHCPRKHNAAHVYACIYRQTLPPKTQCSTCMHIHASEAPVFTLRVLGEAHHEATHYSHNMQSPWLAPKPCDSQSASWFRPASQACSLGIASSQTH